MTADNPSSPDWDGKTRELYAHLLEAWDKRNARDYALLFASDGNLVGFDGSQVNGQLEVGAHLTEIFTHHQTPRYVSIVREVRLLANDVTLLRANTGTSRGSSALKWACRVACGLACASVVSNVFITGFGITPIAVTWKLTISTASACAMWP